MVLKPFKGYPYIELLILAGSHTGPDAHARIGISKIRGERQQRSSMSNGPTN